MLFLTSPYLAVILPHHFAIIFIHVHNEFNDEISMKLKNRLIVYSIKCKSYCSIV